LPQGLAPAREARDMSAMKLKTRLLKGTNVRLEPFVPELKDEVRAAIDCDPESWEIGSVNGCGDGFDDWWSDALKEMEIKGRIAYAIRRLPDKKVVGVSSFLNPRPEHNSIEIGATFLNPEVRTGPVNPESKLLMLAYAFGSGAIRVEFQTDERNARSQSAIEKLGAYKEGVLRNHKITWTGHVRDTVIYSITDTDWPGVKQKLDYRLTEFFV
jgi:RimJ/RimL family protein N-acetyltransferase